MKNIAIVFDTLLFGGIERVGIDYIKLLKHLGYSVDVYILDPKKTEDIIYDISDDCTIHKINFPRLICPEFYWRLAKVFWWGKFIFPIVYVFSKIWIFILKFFLSSHKRYDIAIAFSGHINDLSFVAYNFIKTKKKCCWLHGGLYGYLTIMPGFEVLYSKIKNLIVLKDDFQEEVLFYNKHLKDLKIAKIYNPSYIREKALNSYKINELRNKYGKFILMIARLSLPKNHKSLIRAVKYLNEKCAEEYKLVFVGDGPLKNNLMDFSEEMGMSSICFFEGSQSDPQNYYAAAHIFAFSSFSEGLPTVLIEAASFGLPIVSSDCSVREILGNNEYGLISPIDDYKSLADNLYSLLTNKSKFDKYSLAAQKRYYDFSPKVISKQIEKFFYELK